MRGPQVRFCERRGGATRRAYSTAAAKAGADSGAASRPDPEVVAKAKRRTYTAEYKQRILEEADTAAATRGGSRCSSSPGRLVLLVAHHLAARTIQRYSRSVGRTTARTKSKAQPVRRRKSEATPSGRPIDRKTPQSGDHHRRSKKSRCAVGEPASRRGAGREILMSAVSELAIAVGTSAACQVLWMPRASYYGQRRKAAAPAVGVLAAFAGTRTPPGGTGSGPSSSTRRTFPRSFSSRCLCDLAR